MSCTLKAGFSVSGSYEALNMSRAKGSFMIPPRTLQFRDLRSKEFVGRSSDMADLNFESPRHISVNAQLSNCIGRSLRWWEKSSTPNMIEIYSAQELVDSLLNAGDKLVVVDFYSPGCGGCKALHPKICQLAEMNPNAIFLKVNYEELKPMCHSLHIHVLPFFRFYRGSEGRVCSFSCTNATIKKFKDAVAKYGTERCSLGPAKGLEEKELLALASAGLISRELAQEVAKEKREDLVLQNMMDIPNKALSIDENKIGSKEGNAVLMA